jgi:hypothetical protein
MQSGAEISFYLFSALFDTHEIYIKYISIGMCIVPIWGERLSVKVFKGSTSQRFGRCPSEYCLPIFLRFGHCPSEYYLPNFLSANLCPSLWLPAATRQGNRQMANSLG